MGVWNHPNELIFNNLAAAGGMGTDRATELEKGSVVPLFLNQLYFVSINLEGIQSYLAMFFLHHFSRMAQ